MLDDGFRPMTAEDWTFFEQVMFVIVTLGEFVPKSSGKTRIFKNEFIEIKRYAPECYGAEDKYSLYVKLPIGSVPEGLVVYQSRMIAPFSQDHGAINVHRRGFWESYLQEILTPKALKKKREEELAKKKREEELERQDRERFLVIDDSLLFLNVLSS